MTGFADWGIEQLENYLKPGAPCGTWVEAIDGCVKHDMPVSHYYVAQAENLAWEVRYIDFFACYDGWDSFDDRVEVHGDYREALLAACWYKSEREEALRLYDEGWEAV